MVVLEKSNEIDWKLNFAEQMYGEEYIQVRFKKNFYEFTKLIVSSPKSF